MHVMRGGKEEKDFFFFFFFFVVVVVVLTLGHDSERELGFLPGPDATRVRLPFEGSSS